MDSKDYKIDTSLILSAQNGDENALKCIISKCEGMVRKLAWKQAEANPYMGKEDLEQEAYYYLVKAINAYDVTLNKAKFSTFAYSCVKNGLIDEVRKHSRNGENPLDLESVATVLDDGVSMEDEILSRIYVEDIKDKIRGVLSERDYYIITSLAEKMSYAQIADNLGLTSKQVDGRLQKIRKKLKKIM